MVRILYTPVYTGDDFPVTGITAVITWRVPTTVGTRLETIYPAHPNIQIQGGTTLNPILIDSTPRMLTSVPMREHEGRANKASILARRTYSSWP